MIIDVEKETSCFTVIERAMILNKHAALPFLEMLMIISDAASKMPINESLSWRLICINEDSSHI